jgi:hypothetical protein
MKKLYYLIVLTLILGLVLEQSEVSYLTKHTADDPYTTPLMAGQHDEVGTVSVWNDDTNLCVRYQLSNDALAEGWFLTETHFAVAGGVEYENGDIVPPTPEAIPQKNGNPPPGQFPYGDDNLGVYDNGNLIGGPDFYQECVLLSKLGVVSGDEVYIAAHAVVCKLSDVITATLVSRAETQYAGYTTVNPSSDPLNLLSYTPGVWSDAVDLMSPHSSWYDESSNPFSGASWISYAEPCKDLDYWEDHYRLFKDSFEILAGAVNCQGKLWMSADNDAIAYLDDAINVVGEIEHVYTTISGSSNPFKSPHYYEFTPDEGWNTLYFVVRNWAWGAANSTGLLYKMDYEYQLLECETAWAAGFDFPGNNWATYFAYTVPLHQIEVFAVSSIPVEKVLDVGNYKFVVSGTAFAGGEYTEDIEFDAKYSITHSDSGDTWTDTVSGYESYGEELLDLQVNGISLEWGDYNVDHIYECSWTGGGVVQFCIKDIYYPNNTGYLTVEIYK